MIETEDQARAFVAERCSAEAFTTLERFAAMVLDEAQRQNLIARSTHETIWQRHIADSAQLLDHVPRETRGKWLDLGTGAGFPGLITAIMRPECAHVLVESRTKRIAWLTHVFRQLNLTNVTIAGDRLENLESVDAEVITARAFAPLPKLLGLSARFSTADTIWLLPKGRSAAQERDELDSRHRTMFHVKQSATDRDAAILVGRGQPKIRSRA